MAPPGGAGDPPDAEAGLTAVGNPAYSDDATEPPPAVMAPSVAEVRPPVGLRRRTKEGSRRDMLWQRDPDRVVKYRPEHLHYYGWMPAFAPANLKATVFANVYLHAQAAGLLAWVGVLHATGLWVPHSDLASFLRLFGTPYAGAIFNMAMLITFVLGLFVSLVVNRWSGIKAAYGRLIGCTMDLCMLVCCAVAHPTDPGDQGPLRARMEVTRLLNLGHFLAISSADALDRDFKTGHFLGHGAKALGASVRRGAPAPEDDAMWFKKARDIGPEDLEHEALLNRDEWAMLSGAESEGLARHQVVYFWVRVALLRCRDAGWIVAEAQMLKAMLDKLNGVVEAASAMFNAIKSQMPYPYVALVSFVVHAYLFVTATWYGLFLHVGFPTEETFAGSVGGQEAVLRKGRTEVGDSVWTAAWCYFFVLLANVMFQGLLDMHALMDNPFGAHVAKFPLREHATRLLAATRTMLGRAEELPAAFGDVFPDMAAGLGGRRFEPSLEAPVGLGARRSGSLTPNFLNPPSLGGGRTYREVHADLAWQEDSGSGIATQVAPEASSSTHSSG